MIVVDFIGDVGSSEMEGGKCCVTGQARLCWNLLGCWSYALLYKPSRRHLLRSRAVAEVRRVFGRESTCSPGTNLSKIWVVATEVNDTDACCRCHYQ